MPVAQSGAVQQASPSSDPSTEEASPQLCTSPAAEPTPASTPQPLSQTNQSPPATYDDASQSQSPQTPTANQETNRSSPHSRSFQINPSLFTVYNFAVLILSIIILNLYSDDDPSKLNTWLIVFVSLSFLRHISRYVLRRLVWRTMRIPRIACLFIDTAIYVTCILWFCVAIDYLVGFKDKPQIRSSFRFIFIASVATLELSFCFFVLLFATIIFFCAASPVRGRPSPGATTEDLSKLPSFKFVPPQEDVENPPSEGTNMCSICLGDFAEEELLRELPCPTGKHVFHAECVDEWLTRRLSCPICREDPLRRIRQQEQDQTSNQAGTPTAARPHRNRFGLNPFSHNRPAAPESATERAVTNVDSSS